ncbi:MAG: NAD(+)/NADH kinase, partial [Dolichospermum sp.]
MIIKELRLAKPPMRGNRVLRVLCDLGLVVGGDGTMLGIGRRLAPHAVPLIGINQGRLGFITDIALDGYQAVLGPMLQGQYEEE